MNIELLQAFFMWCSIINLAMLMLMFVLCVFAADWIYAIHSRWFPISRVAFNTILYSFLGVYKMLVLIFNIIPWIALSIIR